MTFERIILHNFGGYKGQHVFLLNKTRPNRPIVLVVGLNGLGKSTLMDGIQLALYGKLAQCAGRGARAYDDYLRRSTHNGAHPKEGRVVLEFRYIVAGKEHQFRLDRSWVCTDRGVREHFDVWKNGQLDRGLADTWQDQMEQWLPVGLSQLFFFDGERIEALADPSTSAAVLRSSMAALLGLDLLKRLESDLTTLRRQKEGLLASNAPPSGYAELQVRAEGLSATRATMFQTAAEITSKSEQWQYRLRECEARVAREGGSLFERRRELEIRQAALTQHISGVLTQLVEIASGAAPFLVLASILDDVALQAQQENEAQDTEVLNRHLSSRDAEVLAALADSGFPLSILSSLRGLLDEDRAQRLAKTGTTDSYLHLTQEGRDQLQALRQTVLEELQGRSTGLLSQLAELRMEEDTVKHQLAAAPTEESLAPLFAQRDMIRGELAKLHAEQTSVDSQASAVRVELERVENDLDRRARSLREGQIDSDNTKRVLDHIDRVKGTLSTFEGRLLRRHISRIEQLTLESLRVLLRKQHLITGLSIDPDSLEISLRTVGNAPLPTDRLSAGERQLLATALLWGLRRASGRVVPLVIDTPLGRLDSIHRQHLVERYFPYASHQVLLLATDSEIDERAYAMLKPWVASAYSLLSDEGNGSTKVEPGYSESLLGDSDVA